jgi:proteasome lid subunit RPN8/RPN11
MSLEISSSLLKHIHRFGEAAYPYEGAGLLLGSANDSGKQVQAILPLSNSREDSARHNRYLLTPKEYLQGEQQAARLGLDVVGVFHSHPDHPNQPSEFDREWAMPWFSYVITTVQAGQASGSRSWLLSEDRQAFDEEPINVTQRVNTIENRE